MIFFIVHGWMGLHFLILSRLFSPVFVLLFRSSFLSAALLIPRFSDVHWTLAVPLQYSTQFPCPSIASNRPSCLFEAHNFL
jgi:hypothetical protein